MSRTARSRVPGYMDREATDLEVMQSLFVDPNYSSGDLPGLLNSADITLDLGTVIESMQGASARVYIQDAATYTVIENRQCPLSDPVQVFTVPASDSGYVIDVNVGGYQFNFDYHIFESKLCGDDYARPVTFQKMNPKGTFLHACEDSPQAPSIISLASFNIEPGDRLLLDIMGGYTYAVGSDEIKYAVAVFSSSNEVLGYDQHYRIPGAINAGDDYEHDSANTFYCNTETDIAQDFEIVDGVIVIVPTGATHLILGTSDAYYYDNGDDDDDYGINLSVLRKE
jgi:hypothetical protein